MSTNFSSVSPFRSKIFFISAMSAAAAFFMVAAGIMGFSPLFFAGVLVFFVSLYFLFTRPFELLLALIVVRMLLDYSSEFISFTVGDAAMVTLSQLIGLEIFALGLIFIFTNFPRLRALQLKFPLVLLAVFTVATAIYSINAGFTIREFLRLTDLFLLFFIAYAVVDNFKKYKILLVAIFASSVIPMLVGLYQYFAGIGFADESVSIPRIFGTFSHPNVFSLYLTGVIALLALYYLLHARDARVKAAAITLILITSGVLFVTYTRIAWIALLAFFLVLGVFKYRKLLLPLVILPLALYLLFPPFQERVNYSLIDSPGSSVQWRKTLWKDAIYETLRDGKQLAGYGANTFSLVSESQRGIRFGSNDPHNDFVKFFVEGGVVGLAVYALFILWLGIALLRYYLRAEGKSKDVFLVLTALFAAMVIASASDNVLKNTPLQWIFWITLGASLRVFGERKPR